MSILTQQIELACLMEATARKPGNVHPGASFSDLTYADFSNAASLSAPHLATSAQAGIGRATFEAIRATRTQIASNVNLGICLLMTPIAAVDDARQLRQGVSTAIEATTVDDAYWAYRAIRIASPGGLGNVEHQDVADSPTVTLKSAMSMAADRDDVARAWDTRFRDIDREASSTLLETWRDAEIRPDRLMKPSDGLAIPPWEAAVLTLHLTLLSQGDTLIRRKCGENVSRDAQLLAQQALTAGGCFTTEGGEAMAHLDRWLRADGHRRNPGTTADLVAATLFWALRKGWITPPTLLELRAHAERIGAAIPAH